MTIEHESGPSSGPCRVLNPEKRKNMKTYVVIAVTDRHGWAKTTRSGPYESRSRAEDAAVAMTAKGYEDVEIRVVINDDDDDDGNN